MQLTSTLTHFSSSPLICEHLGLVVRIFLHLANEFAAPPTTTHKLKLALKRFHRPRKELRAIGQGILRF